MDDGHTEEEVTAALGQISVVRFTRYWHLMRQWLTSHGGDPTGLGNRAIYDDVFHQCWRFIGTADFRPAKAVANTMRFIDVMS